MKASAHGPGHLDMVTIIGVDCATLASRTGLTMARYSGGVLHVEECRIADPGSSVASQVHTWLGTARPALIEW
jgi:hypothetical protein